MSPAAGFFNQELQYNQQATLSFKKGLNTTNTGGFLKLITAALSLRDQLGKTLMTALFNNTKHLYSMEHSLKLHKPSFHGIRNYFKRNYNL